MTKIAELLEHTFHEIMMPELARVASRMALKSLDAAGFVIAPREPTEAMIEAGCRVNAGKDYRRLVYQAMLAAAEQPGEQS